MSPHKPVSLLSAVLTTCSFHGRPIFAWKPQAPNLWVQVSNNLQLRAFLHSSHYANDQANDTPFGIETFRSSSISSRDAGCLDVPRSYGCLNDSLLPTMKGQKVLRKVLPANMQSTRVPPPLTPCDGRWGCLQETRLRAFLPRRARQMGASRHSTRFSHPVTISRIGRRPRQYNRKWAAKARLRSAH